MILNHANRWPEIEIYQQRLLFSLLSIAAVTGYPLSYVLSTGAFFPLCRTPFFRLSSFHLPLA